MDCRRVGRSPPFRRLKRGHHGHLVELYAARLVKELASPRHVAMPECGRRSPELDRMKPFEADRSR
jgi:hypothetical protein